MDTLWPWVLVWCGALSIRLIFAWQIQATDLARVLFGDGHAYDAWAREIASGKWFGDEVFYQAPLYPYFLALIYKIVGHSLGVVRMIQMILGAFSCVCMGLAVSHFFSRSIGLLTGLLMAVCPTLIFFDFLVQKSVLDIFLFTFIWLLAAKAAQSPTRFRWWIAIGCAIGLLALTRENALILLPLFLVWAWQMFQARGAILLLVGTACILFPVVFRNAIVGGGFHLTTSQIGPNFYIGNNEQANGTYQPLLPHRGVAGYERKDATELAEKETGRVLSAGEVSDFWMAKSLHFVRTQPWTWTKLMVWKWFLVWNASELVDTEEQSAYAEFSPLLQWLSVILHFGVFFPLALAGVVWTRDRPSLWLMSSTALVYAVSVAAFFVFARYRLLLYPIVIAFASAAVINARDRFRFPSSRSTCIGIVLILLGAMFANWRPNLNSAPGLTTWRNLGLYWFHHGDSRRAIEWFDRGLATFPDSDDCLAGKAAGLGQLGEFDAATAILDKLIARNPEYPDAQLNNGIMLIAMGKVSESLPYFEKALQLQPLSAEVHYNAGNAYRLLGLTNDALHHYEESTRHQPDFEDGYNNLGGLYLQIGRVDDALQQFRRCAEIRPASARAHANLGLVLWLLGNHSESIKEYKQALQIDGNDVETLGKYAWRLATCPDDRIRDGARAVELADKANELSQRSNPIILRTLAAAHAESGDFQSAISTLSSAIQLLSQSGDKSSVSILEMELDSFRKNRPIRE